MTQAGPDLRVLVHALDRTGPPMLARSVLRWYARHHPASRLEVLAFRGGAMLDDLSSVAPVEVILRDHEPWDAAAPDAARVRELRDGLAGLAPAGVNLLVSVAAGQALPLLPAALGPVVTWVVEVGEDLHWIDDLVELRSRTDRWWAGSEASAAAVASLVGPAVLVPELVDAPRAPAPADVAARRRELGADPTTLVVVGAGIGTWRKGLDLFVEAAALARARVGGPVRFHWVGGRDDPLWPLVERDLARPELAHLSLEPPVVDLLPTLAAADVLLHPARLDAFPLVCLHAAAVATPVVGFGGVGGLGEMLGSSALAAPYPDVEALVAHLIDLTDPVRRAAAGLAQQAAVQRFLAPVAMPDVHAHLQAARAGAWA